ncbi:MAG: hypothetical protein HY905_27365 [Deltaproteobacteria bacterium]|nr:hypothetical protein [Deltaproteobacteria bacterium]
MMPQTTRIRIVTIAIAFLTATSSACPAPPVEVGPVGPVLPAATPAPTAADPAALTEGFTPAHAWRGVLQRMGTWKLTPQEEWRAPEEGAESWLPFDVLFADRAGDEVRVVAAREDLLYAVWIRETDLALVPVEPVTLAPSAGGTAPEDGPRIELAGGALVAVVEQRAGWTRVRTEGAELQADGWVPDVLLGRFYRASDFVVNEETVNLEPAIGLEVRDSPTGAVIATLRSDGSLRMRVRALGEAQNGWRMIRYPTAKAIVEGWVSADGLATASADHPLGPSHTISTWRGRGDFSWLQVPIATEVSLTPDGDVFAVATMGTKFVVAAGHSASRTPVTIHTIWGGVDGWVKCDPIPEGMSQPLIDTCVPPFEE